MDSEWLQQTVQPALSAAIADAVAFRAADPIEYIADYLDYWADKNDSQASHAKDAEIIAAQRAEADERLEKEAAAAALRIQQEYREHLERERQRKAELEAAVVGYENARDELIEQLEPVVVENEEKSEEELKIEEEALTLRQHVDCVATAAKSYLDAGSIVSLAALPSPSTSAIKAIKAALFIAGRTPRQLTSWPAISKLLKSQGSRLSQRFQAFDHSAPQKRRTFKWVRAALSQLGDASNLRTESVTAFVLGDFARAISESRSALLAFERSEKAQGREVEEIWEEVEEEDPEEVEHEEGESEEEREREREEGEGEGENEGEDENEED